MALTNENLNQFFEKSERMNLLQARIKTYTSLLEQRYGDMTYDEVRHLSIPERQMKCAHTDSQHVKLSVSDDALLEFSAYIDDCQPALCPVCRFQILSDGKLYNLTTDQLPSRLIEPVYEVLPRLTALMEQARKAVAAQIESEILAYTEQ